MQLLRRQSVRRKARPDCLDHSRRSRSVHLEWRERREVSEDGLISMYRDQRCLWEM